MNKITAMVLATFVLLSAATAAFAEAKSSTDTRSMETGEFEVDGSFGFATGPNDFDSGYWLNFGAGYMLTAIDKNLQVRLDLSYFEFSYTPNSPGYDLNYTRAPFTVSARYYFPIINRLSAFAQAGLEMSFDSKEYVDFGNKHTKNEVNLGISPGGGIEFFINRDVSVFAGGRWHVVSDGYFSTQFGGAFHF